MDEHPTHRARCPDEGQGEPLRGVQDAGQDIPLLVRRTQGGHGDVVALSSHLVEYVAHHPPRLLADITLAWPLGEGDAHHKGHYAAAAGGTHFLHTGPRTDMMETLGGSSPGSRRPIVSATAT